MPITARKDGTVFYRIDGLRPSAMLASNRQKKVLRLFVQCLNFLRSSWLVEALSCYGKVILSGSIDSNKIEENVWTKAHKPIYATCFRCGEIARA
jgi:hypothetical protein